jgi:hypothetical protein
MRILFVLLLVVVWGCEKSAEKAAEVASGGQVKIDGDTVTIRTEEGEATLETKGETAQLKTKDGTFTAGQNTLPKGFPLPLFAGSKVQQTGHHKPADGNEMYQATASVSAPIEKVTSFYEKTLKDKGLKVDRNEMTMGKNQHVILKGESETVEAAVMVMKTAEVQGLTTTVTWQVKSKPKS